MTRLPRTIAKVLAGLVGLVLIVLAIVYGVSSRRLSRHYAITPAPVRIATDSATIERGHHLATAVAKCVDCHGENFGGLVVVDALPFGRFVGPNLTRGEGGRGGALSDADIARVVRHGVKQDGTPVVFMPSEDFSKFSDDDLGALISYLRTVPPVDNTPPTSIFGPIARALLVTHKLPSLSAEVIDHEALMKPVTRPTDPLEQGRYLASVGGCVGCHGPTLVGGHVPGTPADFPNAANITPAGAVGKWTEEDFLRAMRSGKRPDGTEINPFMPWKLTGKMTDEELHALWTYLRSVAPQQQKVASR
jgi:mono/diheme cytochrome c family protein